MSVASATEWSLERHRDHWDVVESVRVLPTRPGLEAGVHVVRLVTAQSRMDSRAQYGRVASFCAHLSDRTRFVTTGVGQRSDTEEKEVGSKNDHDHESQFLLATFPDGGHPPRLLSITVRGVRLGSQAEKLGPRICSLHCLR